MGMKNMKSEKGPGLKNFVGLSEDQARQMLEGIRWPNGPQCPRCESKNIGSLGGGRPGLYRCRDCRSGKRKNQFTVTVGTIFERSHIKLNIWIAVFNRMCASKKGVSALQIKREMGVSYQTAWFMCHRVRLAMKQEPLSGMLKGTVEVDEAYIGGKPRFKGQSKCGRGTRKTPVVVLVERNGNAVNHRVKRVGAKDLKGAIREVVDRKSTIMTDEWASYRGIGKEFDGGHEVVNHSRGEYVRGNAYTNTAESYFALLKRGIHGAFHHVSKKHLDRYCDEFSFRWNHRKANDAERTMAALRQTVGKRLIYSPPTKK